MYKNFSPVKKEVHYLPTMKRHGIAMCKTDIRFYSKLLATEHLKKLIANPPNGKKKHIPLWESFLVLIDNIP